MGILLSSDLIAGGELLPSKCGQAICADTVSVTGPIFFASCNLLTAQSASQDVLP